jgi:YVTN family beta-propeller protein
MTSIGVSESQAGATLSNSYSITAPSSLEITPDGSRVYVISGGSDDVSIINVATGTVETITIATGPTKIAIAPNGIYTYITTSENKIKRITNSNLAISTITGICSGSDTPSNIEITPDGTFAYVACGLSLAKIDLANQTVAGLISVPSGASSIAIDKTGTNLYTNSYSNPVTQIRISDDSIIKTYSMLNGITTLTINPSSSTIYSVNQDGYVVYSSIPAFSSRIATHIAGYLANTLSIDPSGSFMYAGNPGDGTISVINLSTMSGAGSITSGGAFDIDVNAAGTELWAVSYYTNQVKRFALTSVPGAPTIGTATATSSTTASVTFTQPASNGGATITQYTATSSTGGRTGTISQATSGTISVTGLSPNTTYTFTVTARNSDGNSAASAASNSITTPASTTVPGAPTIGTATVLSSTSASISFTAPASNGGATIETYTATSTPGSLTGTLKQSGSGSITVSGLTPSTSYTFRVTASNSVGTSSASSSTFSITTNASQAEIDAAALAAQLVAAAKRETEKKAARVEILKGISESKIPALQQFTTAEIAGVTEQNLPSVAKEILALPQSERSDILVVQKVAKKYAILDAICRGDNFATIHAQDLSSVGLVPVANQSSITHALRSLQPADRNDYSKISLAIDEQIAIIQRRKERLAAILNLIKSHRPA